jgi:hypothetical protein
MKEDTMAARVALVGAAGRIGHRITKCLLRTDYDLMLCEKGEAGTARLLEQGLSVVPTEAAVGSADFVVLAVGDTQISSTSAELVPMMRPGATLVLLDPSAPLLGEVAIREGINYVVCHPCHPALFAEQPSSEAYRDYYGGTCGVQDIVIALMQGSQNVLGEAERLCRAMFAPVANAHAITLEQMAILEPLASEIINVPAIVLMRDSLEEAMRAGVPREAATAFILGHARAALAIMFGFAESTISDSAMAAIREGSKMVINPEWRKAFDPGQLKEIVRRTLQQ